MTREAVGAIPEDEFLAIKKTPFGHLKTFNQQVIRKVRLSDDMTMPEEFTVTGVTLDQAEEIAARIAFVSGRRSSASWFVVGGINDPAVDPEIL